MKTENCLAELSDDIVRTQLFQRRKRQQQIIELAFGIITEVELSVCSRNEFNHDKTTFSAILQLYSKEWRNKLF